MRREGTLLKAFMKDVLFFRMEHEENFFDELYAMLRKHGIESGILLGAIGMLMNFEIGWFNAEKGVYEKVKYEEAHELISASGNISLKDGEVFAHIHVSLSKPHSPTVGGHLFSGIVCNTVGGFILPTGFKLTRLPGDTFRMLDVVEDGE